MKFRHLFLISAIAMLFVLSACGGIIPVENRGVVAFSPENDRVAIITKDYKLYTTDLNGGNLLTHNGGEPTFQLFTVTVNPFGKKLLYVKSLDSGLHICIEEIGRTATCDIALPPQALLGVLSFLPNGDFLLVYNDTQNKLAMRIYHPNGSTATEQNGFDQFFIARDVYKVKGTRWYITPYTTQSVRWILTSGPDTYLFTAANSSETGSVMLPGKINSAVQDALVHRSLIDIKSGILSPDGSKIAFRTENGPQDSKTYNLYVLDLSTENKPFSTLVTGSAFPIEFGFSPDSSQIVYESNQDGRSVWIANADGSAPFKLADNASMPNWWQ